jgi:hypothetical protein
MKMISAMHVALFMLSSVSGVARSQGCHSEFDKMDNYRTPARRTFFYEHDNVTLKGTLNSRVCPGPPNYTDIRDGDEAFPVLYMLLDSPLNAKSNTYDVLKGREEDTEFGVRVMQIIASPDVLKVLKKDFPSKNNVRVRIKGRLTHAVWGRNYTRVLIESTDLTNLGAR